MKIYVNLGNPWKSTKQLVSIEHLYKSMEIYENPWKSEIPSCFHHSNWGQVTLGFDRSHEFLGSVAGPIQQGSGQRVRGQACSRGSRVSYLDGLAELAKTAEKPAGPAEPAEPSKPATGRGCCPSYQGATRQ